MTKRFNRYEAGKPAERLLTVATLRRKALTLSVISGPAADPSTAEGGGGTGDLVVSSHGREGLTK